MSSLVEELKKEHVKIAHTLNNARNAGVMSEEGRSTLADAKSALLAHLKKEDSFLYPVLRKAARQDDGLSWTLDMFAQDMDEITRLAFDFFDRYSAGGSDEEFAREFERLYALITERMVREENMIYRKYDEIIE